MASRKTWREKMANPNLPKVVAIPPRMQKKLGAGSMVLPSGRDVDEAIRAVPEGRVTTVGRLREQLAAKYAVETACPLVTGIMVWVAAGAAEEDARAGRTPVTPYWRVVKDDGSLNPRFPGGIVEQARRLRDEGLPVAAGKVLEGGLCETGKHATSPVSRNARRGRGIRGARP
jgi:alkylated DNA nucleotide flippase Atl1